MNRAVAAIAAFALWSALLLVGGFAAGWWWQGDRAAGTQAGVRAATAEAAVDQVQKVRAEEHAKGQRMADIGAKHEADREAAKAVPDAVVADLRADRLRLRNDLATCNTARLSSAVASSLERDAGAQLRDEIAGDLVRVGRDADNQVRSCHAVIFADREQVAH